MRPLAAAALLVLIAVPLHGQDLIATGDEAGRSEDVRFPAWAFTTIPGAWGRHGWVNVRNPPYNAKGDGVADDTQAINQAFKDVHNGMVYLPAGTYLVSDSVSWDHWSMRDLHGQGRGKTIIKLKDHCPGFDKPAAPKAVVATSGGADGSNSPGSVSFVNSVHFLTIDTGVGNPGAIGLDWYVSNDGSVRHVTIRSGDGAGACGISYHGESCGLAYDVTIAGFDCGLRADAAGYCNLVGDTLRFTDQRSVVIDPGHEIVDFNNVTARGPVPFVTNISWAGRGTYSNLACTYTGSDPKAACFAIGDGRVLVRNLTTTGYATPLAFKGAAVGPAVADLHKAQTLARWTSQEVKTALGLGRHEPLDLPLKPAPEWHSNDFAKWVNLADFLAKTKTPDLADALQQAIDSGAEVVFVPPLPEDRMVLGKTVLLRGKLKLLLGWRGFAKNGPTMAPAFAGPALRVVDGDSPLLTIAGLHEGDLSLEVDTRRTVVVRESNFSSGLTTGAHAGGELYVENHLGGIMIGKGCTAWVRGSNPYPIPPARLPKAFAEVARSRFACLGGTLWVLGVFAEGDAGLGAVGAGGRLEVYGYNHQSSGDLAGRAAFTCADGSLFVAHWQRHQWNQFFLVLLHERQGEKTADVGMAGAFLSARTP